MNKAAILTLNKVCHSYQEGQAGELEVLKGVDLTLKAGEIVALVGQSGTGKSTLLHIAGLLDQPTSGKIAVQGQDCNDLSDDKRTQIRRDMVGFVYQFHHLLPEFTAEENVILPQLSAGISRETSKKRAQELLIKVGLKNRLTHRPTQLSGGEQQRVAIARALANKPKLILADEPTGNLDVKTAETVFDLFLDIVRGEGSAALIATHNPDLAKRMDRTLTIEAGVIRD